MIHPVANTPGLWSHTSRPIFFALVVDDFGIQYSNVDDAHYLLNTLRKIYNISVDWSGKLYCGLKLQWNYKQRTLQMSMPSYVHNALHKFQHPTPHRKQHAPSPWSPPKYGQRIQYTDDPPGNMAPPN